MSRQADTLENNYILITKIVSRLFWMEWRNSSNFLGKKTRKRMMIRLGGSICSLSNENKFKAEEIAN